MLIAHQNSISYLRIRQNFGVIPKQAFKSFSFPKYEGICLFFFPGVESSSQPMMKMKTLKCYLVITVTDY